MTDTLTGSHASHNGIAADCSGEPPCHRQPGRSDREGQGMRRRLGIRGRRRGGATVNGRPTGTGGRVLGVAAATRLGYALLWALLIVGVVSGVSALALHATSEEAPAAVAAPAPTTGPEGLAELFVAAWLGQAGRGAEEAVAPFYAGDASLRDVTPGGLYVLRTATLAAEQVAPGYWAVTVAADVLAAVDGVYTPAGVRYYTVGVAERDGALVAAGPPSQVPTPARGEPPRLAVSALSTPDGDARSEAAHRFLAALLAGEGELGRYTAPGVELSPVDPPPFVGVALQRTGARELAPGRVLLHVEVAGVDAGGLTHVLGYALELAERAGRWEVAALHRAPPLPP